MWNKNVIYPSELVFGIYPSAFSIDDAFIFFLNARFVIISKKMIHFNPYYLFLNMLHLCFCNKSKGVASSFLTIRNVPYTLTIQVLNIHVQRSNKHRDIQSLQIKKWPVSLDLVSLTKQWGPRPTNQKHICGVVAEWTGKKWYGESYFY